MNGYTQPLKKVFSTRSAKDSLKNLADGDLERFRGNSQETVTITVKQEGSDTEPEDESLVYVL
jgi:hypothetical protein